MRATGTGMAAEQSNLHLVFWLLSWLRLVLVLVRTTTNDLALTHSPTFPALLLFTYLVLVRFQNISPPNLARPTLPA